VGGAFLLADRLGVEVEGGSNIRALAGGDQFRSGSQQGGRFGGAQSTAEEPT
jgi:hypothetical protein